MLHMNSCATSTVRRRVPAATLRASQQHGEYTWMGVIPVSCERAGC